MHVQVWIGKDYFNPLVCNSSDVTQAYTGWLSLFASLSLSLCVCVCVSLYTIFHSLNVSCVCVRVCVALLDCSAHNTVTDAVDRTKVCRLPWHEVSGCVVGLAARDFARHFIQHWNHVKVGLSGLSFCLVVSVCVCLSVSMCVCVYFPLDVGGCVVGLAVL
jgi:hypothetical protein